MDVCAVAGDVIFDFGLCGVDVSDEPDDEVGGVGGELAEEFELLCGGKQRLWGRRERMNSRRFLRIRL